MMSAMQSTKIYCASAVCPVLCHRESPAFMKHPFYWGRQTIHRETKKHILGPEKTLTGDS